MKDILLRTCLLCSLLSAALAFNSTYSYCQLPKPQGQQLLGCPNGTVYVSQTDPQSGFGSVSPFGFADLCGNNSPHLPWFNSVCLDSSRCSQSVSAVRYSAYA